MRPPGLRVRVFCMDPVGIGTREPPSRTLLSVFGLGTFWVDFGHIMLVERLRMRYLIVHGLNVCRRSKHTPLPSMMLAVVELRWQFALKGGRGLCISVCSCASVVPMSLET
ncbi:hypothetical protein K466DRAFT_262627 [Polyporus arcularius HHB13444]|uniref:Uncharacterized protein n=1 Tax=Polyporus arcularius HHB13444 TaxID=1314778 RepID=A0A5C3P4A3_9APHY|nr:hypothetical protein K466DRAFT_262627 [Polyporus arcularius HHB13444]